MADDTLFQGGTAPSDPTRAMPGTDEPTLADHDAPPGMSPGRDPLSDDRPEDWKDPPAADDVPPADEPTPLSDDRR